MLQAERKVIVISACHKPPKQLFQAMSLSLLGAKHTPRSLEQHVRGSEW
eukprot:COSAG01_NODE_31224_length_601_cov_1.093625_1_plen_48_part_10